MDAREFYTQLDKADDELEAVSGDLWEIFRGTYHLQHIFSDLAEKAAEIEDKEKRDRFKTVLLHLRDRLYEIGKECYKVSGEIATVREYDLRELFVEANKLAKEEEEKGLSEADNN